MSDSDFLREQKKPMLSKKRINWTKDEDETLINAVQKQGTMHWDEIARTFLPSRTGKQCRERWYFKLNPATNQKQWTDQDDKALLYYHSIFGNRWTVLIKFFPGRSNISIKNRWNLLSRKSHYSIGMPNFNTGPSQALNSAGSLNSLSNSMLSHASSQTNVSQNPQTNVSQNPPTNESQNPQVIQVFPLLDPGQQFPSLYSFLDFISNKNKFLE